MKEIIYIYTIKITSEVKDIDVLSLYCLYAKCG